MFFFPLSGSYTNHTDYSFDYDVQKIRNIRQSPEGCFLVFFARFTGFLLILDKAFAKSPVDKFVQAN